VTVLHLMICLLPKPNLDLLSVLIRFLVEVASYSNFNKMDIPNLATVIAPNILYSKSGAAEHSSAVIDIVRLLLQCNRSVFKVISFN
jgi:hypothetical protein